jgi:hypothetical protein
MLAREFITYAKDIERTITDFSRGSNCGLISVATARHRLPQ